MRKEKAYRFRMPSPVELAKIIHGRCERNAERIRAQGEYARVGTLRRRDNSFDFLIQGQSQEQAAALFEAYTEKYGVKEAKQVLNEGDAALIGLPGSINGRIYGYILDVRIQVKPMFDVLVTTQGQAPKAILRCLEAAYNDLAEEYGLVG
jgi:hypothetical protein